MVSGIDRAPRHEDRSRPRLTYETAGRRLLWQEVDGPRPLPEGAIMQVFVSYARQDQPRADVLATRLTQLGHTVWVDRRLTGGGQWWEEILHNVRAADVLVSVLSQASLHSPACTYERQYAAKLGKHVLPVRVQAFRHELLPADLSTTHLIDYIQSDEDAAIALARQAAQFRTAPPLPNPLPPGPPAPLSYLSHLGQRLSVSPLPQEEQMDIVTRLESAFGAPDEEERAAARTLLDSMRGRPDIFASTERRLSQILVGAPGAGPAAARHVPVSPVPSTSAGTPKAVKVLAWIGAVVVLIVVLGIMQGLGSGSEEPTCYNYAGQVVRC